MSTQTPSRSPDQQTTDMQATDMQSAPTREMANAQNMSNRQMQQTLSEMQNRMADDRQRTRGNETKPAYRTTEFYIYLAAVGGTLLAADMVGVNAEGVDLFRADNAWFFITLMTIAYLASRGLAKLGSSWRKSDRSDR